MEGKWVEVSIDEAAEVIGGGTPSTKDDANWGGDIPWITPKDLSGYYFRRISHGERNISQKGLRESSAKLLPVGAVLLTTRAPIGYLAITSNPLTTNQGFRNLVMRNGYLNEYFYYLLNNHTDILKAHASGTTFAELSGSSLKKLKFLIPPFPTQQAIAHILSSFDDKIELNRKINQTCNSLAQALFKNWLVDFEPVRAKAEGRDTSLPKDLADLFPNSFENSEVGQIPRGWSVTGLDSIATFLNGLALQNFPVQENEDLPVIKIAQLRKGNTIGADLCSKNIPGQYIINNGDVLFSWSGSLECVVWAGGTGALNQHLFKVTSSNYPEWFFYLWILEHLSSFRAIAQDKATTMGHIQRHHLNEAKVIVPPNSTISSIHNIIGPFFERATHCKIESLALAKVRDTLLPKLISGALDLKNTERFCVG